MSEGVHRMKVRRDASLLTWTMLREKERGRRKGGLWLEDQGDRE